jgi:hypothetical protein
MLDNANIGVVMTIRKPISSTQMTNIEMEVYKDERLKRCSLRGLEPDLLPIFACQYLNIVGIPRELRRYPYVCHDNFALHYSEGKTTEFPLEFCKDGRTVT